MTPFKEVTQEDFDKTKDDLESVLKMFQKFVHDNRPELDIDAVATGEVWFGTDAVKRGLCDQISTADDILIDYVDKGWDVYEVQYKKPRDRLARLPGLGVQDKSIDDTDGNILNRGIRWLVRSVASELKSLFAAETASLAKSKQPELQYMAQFEGVDRIRTERPKY